MHLWGKGTATIQKLRKRLAQLKVVSAPAAIYKTDECAVVYVLGEHRIGTLFVYIDRSD